jgi:hypothetical protein
VRRSFFRSFGIDCSSNFAFQIIDETFSEGFFLAMDVLVAVSHCTLAFSTPHLTELPILALLSQTFLFLREK